MVEFLCKKGANVNNIDYKGNTPLHKQNKNIEIA